jgi:protein CWC15
LLEAEAAHYSKKNGGKSAPESGVEQQQQALQGNGSLKRQLENGPAAADGEGSGEEDAETKRRRILEETRDIDADSDGDDDDESSEEERYAG